jgi:hypothetical protein
MAAKSMTISPRSTKWWNPSREARLAEAPAAPPVEGEVRPESPEAGRPSSGEAVATIVAWKLGAG